MYTALDISKRSEFQLWHQMNEFVDALGTRAYDAVAKAGMTPKVAASPGKRRTKSQSELDLVSRSRHKNSSSQLKLVTAVI
jgi:hypothetical protein